LLAFLRPLGYQRAEARRDRAQSMSGASKAEWLAVLEVASQPGSNKSDPEWEWLMQQLGLGPEYFLAVRAAVKQGRWRGAKNPKSYVKTVAKREAARMCLLSQENDELVFPAEIEVDGEEVSQEERLDHMLYRHDSVKPVKGLDGVWRSGGGWDRDYGDEREDYESYRGFLAAKVPGEFKNLVSLSQESEPVPRLHWLRWAEAAGLDKWERQVLQCKLTGVSREGALRAQPDDGSRKALQAAWKRFDRNGMERLLAAAKKISVENVPE
jgi:hypothetical protein